MADPHPTPPRTSARVSAVTMAATLAVATATGCAQVHVEKTRYGMWPDAYRISNASTVLVVVPTGGRVIRYGPLSGPNLFWENPAAQTGAVEGGWPNYGGDKIWIWPQDQWPKVLASGWPPPAAVDQGRYDITPTADGVRLVSPVQTEYGVRVVREITLASEGTQVTSRTHLEAAAGKLLATPIAAWEVTQVDNPAQVLVRLQAPFAPATTMPAKPRDAKWLGIHQLPNGLWELPRPADISVKEFFPGDLVAGVTQGYALVQQIAQPDPKTNPEPPLQVYSNQQHDPARPASVPSYVEFEFLSAPQVFAGASVKAGPDSVVTWTYHALPPAAQTPAEVAAHVAAWAEAP